LRANILVVGLDELLEAELCRALRALRHSVLSEAFTSAADCLATIERAGADLVFCGTDRRQYEPILEDLRQRGQAVPVVVVSRLPETGDWLDAMDAGACDYCAAPFEPKLVERIVENTLQYPCAVPLAG
jgi:DNA-binding NtrC family response regulator